MSDPNQDRKRMLMKMGDMMLNMAFKMIHSMSTKEKLTMVKHALTEHLSENGKLQERDIVWLMMQVCLSINHADEPNLDLNKLREESIKDVEQIYANVMEAKNKTNG